jgi:hypothetical protein
MEVGAPLVRVVARGTDLIDELLGEHGGCGRVIAAGEAAGSMSLPVYLVWVALISCSIAAEVLALQYQKQEDWQNEKPCEAKNYQWDSLYHVSITKYVI